jgi:Domain of unknown function (DUF4287)/Domain of unknown function (DUF5655)
MVKTSQEFEQEFIDTAEEKTGYTVEQWVSIVKNTGLAKQQDIMKWLKNNHQLNYMQASLLSGICLNNGKAVYNWQNLLDNQFINCKAMRHLYNHVAEKILLYFKDAQCIPKKTYISCLAIKEFAAIKIEPEKIIIGMAVDNMAGNNLLQKAVLPGPSPAITHIVSLTGIRQFNSTVINYLQSSYNYTHNKK